MKDPTQAEPVQNKESASGEAWSLGLKDLAALLDGCLDDVSKTGKATLTKVLVEMIAEDGRCDEQIATLREMAETAGSKFLGDGLLVHRELEQLLAAEGWTHPAEVLEADPEDVAYAELIRAVAARAERTDDPESILDVKRRLEEAEALFDASRKLFDSFIAYLLELDPEPAQEHLDRLTAHYQFRRQQPDWRPPRRKADTAGPEN